MRRLGGIFEASVGVLAHLVDVLGPSGGHLAGVLGATWGGLGRLRFVLGRAGALRKMLKNHWFYSVLELLRFTKDVCEVLDAAQARP